MRERSSRCTTTLEEPDVPTTLLISVRGHVSKRKGSRRAHVQTSLISLSLVLPAHGGRQEGRGLDLRGRTFCRSPLVHRSLFLLCTTTKKGVVNFGTSQPLRGGVWAIKPESYQFAPIN